MEAKKLIEGAVCAGNSSVTSKYGWKQLSCLQETNFSHRCVLFEKSRNKAPPNPCYRWTANSISNFVINLSGNASNIVSYHLMTDSTGAFL